MLSRFLNWLRSAFPVFFEEKMPVWMTILASLAAATLTYYFAPMYSRQFQIEDGRSAHLKQTTDQLNSEIIELSQKVRRFDSALVNEKENASDLREDCLDLVTKLQWRLVDLRVILTHPDDEKYVSSLSKAIEALRVKLNAPVTVNYTRDVRTAMGVLGSATAAVLDRLYAKASLQG
ncbi:hypothetical protein [Sphingobium sp. B2D3C]|uniref:hypothetical protein n=1 Tax=Sphingobium sp. B2D3C TaxID=2940581 RepID=UPI002224AC24|nr:hypothetical protein [Sphingobium sp. B2D3C]MCW2399670.1 type VI protein secretion system component VasF [Sphingobium sp. B2D3C]